MTNFKLIAGTHVGLRQNNEDNFTVCADLTKKDWSIPVNYHEEIRLSERGCILVVADGMGGQNAGEVASSIAVETVQEMFAPHVLPDSILDSNESIDNYLKKVICEADVKIKKTTRENPTTSGMGSTIVIAWIINNLAHIAWLGDSRAYCVIKDRGIARLSKDHSYVQSLVDAGKISDEQALTHPDSNIINRSLGDTSQKAKPEVTSIELVEGEVILLCSDGLCGVCPDSEIGGIVEDNIADLKSCREELISAALKAGGSDNITVAMIHISKCDNVSSNPKVVEGRKRRKIKWNPIIYSALIAVIAVLVGVLIRMSTPVVSYSLEVHPDCVNLNKGQKQQLAVKYYTLIDGNIDPTKTLDVTDKCEWISTASNIVSVSQRGTIKAVGHDSVSEVIAIYGGCRDTIKVMVNPVKQVVKFDAKSDGDKHIDLQDLLVPDDNDEDIEEGIEVTTSNVDTSNTNYTIATIIRPEVNDTTALADDTSNVVNNDEANKN